MAAGVIVLLGRKQENEGACGGSGRGPLGFGFEAGFESWVQV